MVLRDVLTRIEENKKSMEFMKTGFVQLDDVLDGGLLRRELVVLGASTGIGKSYFAGQLMVNIAQQGFKCGYFSLEISNEMVVTRMIGAKANIKPTRVQAGLLTAEEYQRKLEAKAYIETLGDYMEFFDQSYELDEIKKIVKENGYEFVVVDFIQNVMSSGNEEYSRLTKISLELQRLAKECNCTIFALSQLSNTASREGSGGKTLEYKGSGAIAMVADLGFFLERIEDQNMPNIQAIKLMLKKNRRGISGLEFTLFFKIPGGQIYEA